MNRQNHSEPENQLTPEEKQEFLELLARLSPEQREALKKCSSPLLNKNVQGGIAATLHIFIFCYARSTLMLPVRASLITRKRFLHPVHILVWFVPPVAGRRINTRPQSGHSTEIIAMRNYLPKLFNCRQVIRLSCHHKNLFKPLCLL